MEITQDTFDLVAHFETEKLIAYLCPAGRPTIGYGHTRGVTLDDVKRARTITSVQAFEYLQEDMASAAADVARHVHVALAAHQHGALCSFVFNLGGPALASSTLLTVLNNGDFAMAAKEFTRWNKARNPKTGALRPLKGLTRRRIAEELLFRGEDWQQYESERLRRAGES